MHQIFEAMAVLTPRSLPHVSVVGDTFSSVGRVLRNISAGLALSLPLAVAWVEPARALLIYNFYESAGDLVVQGTGSLNLPSSPVDSASLPVSTGLLALVEGFIIGTPNSTATFDVYAVTGPSTLGAGVPDTTIFSSSDSGISSALLYIYGYFAIDPAYASGATIDSSSTFSGITLASLGMTNSGLLGTWTLYDPSDLTYIGDTISVQVTTSSSGGPASVPGPLPTLGLAAAFGFSRKLRKRIKLHKGTSDISNSAGS